MKLECNIVKDLLPNYIEGLTSEQTEELLKEHLMECEKCREIYKQMQTEIPAEQTLEVPPLKKLLKKTKWVYALELLYILGAIGIFVTLVVDFAINRKLTWSIIAVLGIIYPFAGITVCWKAKRERLIKVFAWESILLFPMLYIFEIVINKNFLQQPISWFFSIAVPVSLLWLGILWAMIFLYRVCKINCWYVAGIFCLASSVGTIFTNAVASRQTLQERWNTGEEIINLICLIFLSILWFVIGTIRKGKQNERNRKKRN